MTFGQSLELFAGEYLGAAVLRFLAGTGRMRVSGYERYQALRAGSRGTILALWHRELFAGVYAFRSLSIRMIVSQHFDGELITRVIRHFGYSTARGSTTRGGVRALVELIKAVEVGEAVGFTPDGPRGPRCKAQMGVVYLAQRTGRPIVPLGCMPRDYWVLNSWDRFIVPKPRTRIGVVYGDPVIVPPDKASLEECRSRLEQALNAAMEQAEQLAREA